MKPGVASRRLRWCLLALGLAAYPACAHMEPPAARRVAALERVEPGADARPREASPALPHRPGTPSAKVHAQLLRTLYSTPRPALARKGAAPADAAKPESSGGRSPARQLQDRTRQPVVTVASAGPNQAGYVHFFLIRGPDEVLETQVGIELPDQRIAWAFPGLGVSVSHFIESGQVDANGALYEVAHIYGLRPFPDDDAMRELQAEVANRVAPWIDDEVGYCYLKPAGGDLCVSCLGFVMRILFPGRSPEYPTLPRDFNPVVRDTLYTTEDLLLYLAGLHGLAGHEARRKRIEELAIPPMLRDDLIRLVDAANAPPARARALPSAAGTPPKAPLTRQRSTRKL